ncbi:MAG: twin-arginine translocation signal domain-containing protein [Deltaproteobacteria bacterium]|nr:twin-arginine translocation signal domain-containing protein [Planctomycetota bacterium]MBI3758449.1 twin-arginine translocation signal domain-containing protein [Deltaproteobacteria bacterium]
MFPLNTTHGQLTRRAFLKATLATAGGMAIANWGGRVCPDRSKQCP